MLLTFPTGRGGHPAHPTSLALSLTPPLQNPALLIELYEGLGRHDQAAELHLSLALDMIAGGCTSPGHFGRIAWHGSTRVRSSLALDKMWVFPVCDDPA